MAVVGGLSMKGGFREVMLFGKGGRLLPGGCSSGIPLQSSY